MRDAHIARRIAVAWAIAALALPAVVGCSSFYSFRPPYTETVKTVYVPVFRTITFRRDLNLQLTELVIKEIERRTPFKVVGNPEGADSTLEGVIKYSDKNLIVENPNNLPRQLTASITVEVTWTNNKNKEKVRDPVVVTETVNFIPEVGESSSTAFATASQRLAQQIVGMMETPW